MEVVVAPLQYSWLVKTNGVGVGLTVMVNVFGIPLQPNAFVGVTVMVATKGEIPAFVAVKTGIFPVPLAANPIEGVLLVHEKIVPAMVLLKAIPFCMALLQSVKLLRAFTVGSGLTVIVNVFGVPVQPFNEGVTVIVAVKAVLPVLVSVKGFMFPVPIAGRPILVFELFQVNTVPDSEPLKVMASGVCPLHFCWFGIAPTVGVGLITKELLVVVEPHSLVTFKEKENVPEVL